jgi:hypothetical protein
MAEKDMQNDSSAVSTTSVVRLYPVGLPPKLRGPFDRPAQFNLEQLRPLGRWMDVYNANHLPKSKLVAEIVAWKIDYKEIVGTES